MSEEGRVEAPERIRVCIRAGKADWIGVAYADETADPDAIHEYIRAQLPTADAEGVALEVVRSLYNANCFECSDVFCTHWQSSAASIIYDALSAAEQRGRDEQREKDARLVEGYHENPSTNDYNIAAAIRSNQ